MQESEYSPLKYRSMFHAIKTLYHQRPDNKLVSSITQ